MTNEELLAAYDQVRARCTTIGRSLSAEQAAIVSACCPAWTVKDLFAHMTGVAVDIIEGNLDGVATEPWADAQVARRAGDDLATVMAEWQATHEQIDAFLRKLATQIPPPFFIDAWTHEWDVRQTLGLASEPDLALPRYVRDTLLPRLQEKARDHGIAPTRLVVEDGAQSTDVVLGTGEPESVVAMSLFELMRVTMGRRSRAQIEALGGGADPDVLVIWSPADQDITDPVA